jgi:hypothetical protein
MSSSSEQSYEDDFENSVKEEKKGLKPVNIVTSPKSTPSENLSPKYTKNPETLTSPKSNKPPAKAPRKEISPKLSEVGKVGYRPNEIFEKEIQPGKKSLKNLEKENQQLRSDLKFLNDRISSILEGNLDKPLKISKKPLKEDKSSSGTIQKKLLNYELEYLRLKQIYQKFNDVECLIMLKTEVKDKKQGIETLEKDLKTLKISIENKQKDLNNFDDFQLPEEKLNHQQLMNENIKLIDQLQSLEQNISNLQEKKVKASKVEEDLQEKYEKLSTVASNYIVELGDVKSQDLFQSSKKTLENLLKVSQVSLTQLRIKEHDLKNEEKRLDHELKKFQMLLKEKDDLLNQVRIELDDALHLASSSKLEHLATLLKSNSRSISTFRSASPRAGTMVGVKSDSSLKDLNNKNLMNSLNLKNSEKNEKNESQDEKVDMGKEGLEKNQGKQNDEQGVLVFAEKKGEGGRNRIEKGMVETFDKDKEIYSNKGIETEKNETFGGKKEDIKENFEVFSENNDIIKKNHRVDKEIKKDIKERKVDIERELEFIESELDKSLKDLKELDMKKESPKGFLYQLEDQPKPKGGFFEELEKSIKKSEFLMNLEEPPGPKLNPLIPSPENFSPKHLKDSLDAESDEKSLKSTKELQFSSLPSNPSPLPLSSTNPFSSIALPNPKQKRNRDHLFK